MNDTTNSQPTLSIVAISHNRPQELLELLQSLLVQYPYEDVVKEVIILNNGSTADYSKVASFVAEHPELLIQYSTVNENLGVAKGKTWVLERASAPYIMVVDDDAEFNKPGDLKKIAGILEKPFFVENNTAIVTVGIYYHSTRQRQINAFPHKNYKEFKDKPYFLTSFFLGGGSVVKKEAVAKVDYYRHEILYGMEEYDLGYRLIHAGYTLGYDDEVLVWHKESPLGRVSSNEKLALMWHNKARIMWIFFPALYYHTTSLLWGIRYLIKTKGDFKGWWQTIKKIKNTIKETPREPINEAGLQYINRVDSRLWY